MYFIEGMPLPTPDRHPVLPGNVEPENWAPYKVWCGDLYECEGCGAQIISGVGRAPLTEHYKPDFEEWVIRTNATFQVNDC